MGFIQEGDKEYQALQKFNDYVQNPKDKPRVLLKINKDGKIRSVTDPGCSIKKLAYWFDLLFNKDAYNLGRVGHRALEGKSGSDSATYIAVLQSARDNIRQKMEGTSKTAAKTTQAVSQQLGILPSPPADAQLVRDTKVKGKHQETDVRGYDWKDAYSKKGHLQEYAKTATCAIIACRGTLSNYSQIPFQDPQSQVTFKSAEQMFHFYKFPPASQARSTIASCPNPDSARTQARSLANAAFQKPGVKEAWDSASKQLMVFIQLAKALEPTTGLLDALDKSGNAFIIEDTSKRQMSQTPEKIWGDNGDGKGDNWLGWAQMEARKIVQDKGGTLTQADVTAYFAHHVQPLLETYYQKYNTRP